VEVSEAAKIDPAIIKPHLRICRRLPPPPSRGSGGTLRKEPGPKDRRQRWECRCQSREREGPFKVPRVQIPNPKHKIPNKFHDQKKLETINLRRLEIGSLNLFGFRDLKIGAYLLFGAWDLEFIHFTHSYRFLQQIRLDELVQVPVQHGIHVADFKIGAVVFGQAVGLKDVRSDLASPGDVLLGRCSTVRPSLPAPAF